MGVRIKTSIFVGWMDIIELEEESECSESDPSGSEPDPLGLLSHIHLSEEIV